MYFLKYRFRKTGLDKCLKSHVSEDPSRDNMAKGSKDCCNLNGGTFTKIVNHSGADYVGKSLF